jgi:phosphoglycolate phosphatase
MDIGSPDAHICRRAKLMRCRLAILDFDGTLANSFPLFIQVFNRLAEKHGFREISPDLAPSLRRYNARQMIKLVGLPSWKLPLVAKSFVSLMRENVTSVALFEGVDDVLSHLAMSGVSIAVVSSNSYGNVSEVLGPRNFELINHLECGVSIFGKSAKIARVLKKAAVSCNEAIYIGDQLTDLEASRKAGVAFGAVSWGYATIESLREHHPDQEFGCVSDIKRIA